MMQFKNIFWGLLVFFPYWVSAQMSETEINQILEETKLEILCKTVDFMLKQSDQPDLNLNLDCQSVMGLENSIPNEARQARRIVSLFKDKSYQSFGKDKLEQRLKKLIDDLGVELKKLSNKREWKDNLEVFVLELKSTKDDALKAPDKTQNTTTTTSTQKPSTAINTPNTSKNEPYMAIYLIVLALVVIGGFAFLYWQNQQLKNQLLDLEDFFQEKYSRLDNRLDLMSPKQDYQALLLKFNFMNDQLNALIQEIMVLKTRNEHKMTIEELYAKRTEHLEAYQFNPEVQIYYAKVRPNQKGFLQADFKTEPARDSIFKVEINLETPQQAVFGVVNRSEYHQVALTNAELMLAPACDYANDPYNDSRIMTLETGILEKKDDRWVILKKAKIAFE
jgi:cell division protein FtsL